MVEDADETTTEPVKSRARVPGCFVKSAVLAGLALAGGVYLMGRWDRINGAGRAGAVVLVVAGTALLLPAGVLLLAAAGKFYFRRRIMKPLEGMLAPGREMVERNKAIFAERQEHRPATDADFAALDRGWYDATTADLTALGFVHLGDVVNVSIERATGVVTVIRMFASADGTTVAGMFHLVLNRTPGGGGKRIVSLEFQTELATDGSFYVTSNTAATDLTTPPPMIHREKYPMDVPPAELAAAHERRRAALLASDPPPAFVAVGTLAEGLAMQQREHLIKAAFRKGIGYVDPAEVRRIAERSHGDDAAFVAAVTATADIARRQERMRSAGQE